jgi:putative transcriptional regulator
MSEKVMNEKVYNRIKAVLAEERKTNMWLAEQLEMSPNTVSKWCTNQMQPTIETLFRIAGVLDVEARELLVNSKK